MSTLNFNFSLAYHSIVILYFIFIPKSKADFIEFSQTFTNTLISEQFRNCKLSLIAPEHLSDSFSYNFLPINHNLLSGQLSTSIYRNISYKRVMLEDVAKYNSANCAFAVLLIPDTTHLTKLSTWLFETTTPAYAPLIKKDEDRLLFFCLSSSTCDKIMISPEYGNRVKYKISISPKNSGGDTIEVKTVSLFGGDNGTPILKSLDSSKLTTLFPDTTLKFNGKIFRVSNPRTKTYFDVETQPDGSKKGTRGLYKMWLDVMMIKFNSSYIVFESSLSGGSGKKLPNGTWRGTVGDVMDGSADMGAFVGHTFSRHGVVGYSTTITYEWMFLITHKPWTYYSSTAIFRPLSAALWIGFLISLVFMTVTFKVLLRDQWALKSQIDYFYTSFIEQDASSSLNLDGSPVRVLVVFWLIFSLIFSTAYRGKLVSLIAFPMSTWIPLTYEDLAYSDFGIGLHVIGKGGAADSIFSSSSNPVFQILNSKMEYYSTPTKCMKNAVAKDLACVLWKCHFEYGLHDGFTDKFGRSPFYTSSSTTYFLHDGYIWEPRAVFHQHIDRVGWSILEMGIVAFWLKSDHKVVMDMRFERERAEKANRTKVDGDEIDTEEDGEEEAEKLKLVQFKGLFILYICGIFIALSYFSYERWAICPWEKLVFFVVHKVKSKMESPNGKFQGKTNI